MKQKSIRLLTVLTVTAVALSFCVLLINADSADADDPVIVNTVADATTAFGTSTVVQFAEGLNLECESNFTIPAGKTLIIPEGTTLDGGSSWAIIVNGTIINEGILKVGMGSTGSPDGLIKNYGRLELNKNNSFYNNGKIFSISDVMQTGSDDPNYAGLSGGGFFVKVTLTKGYDGDPADVSMVRSGTYVYELTTEYGVITAPGDEEVGDHTVTIDFTDPGTSDIVIPYSVTKGDPVYSAPTKKTDLVYNTEAQVLANAGTSTTPGEFTYCATIDGTFVTGIPTGTAVGSYSVYFKFTPTDTEHYNSVGATLVADDIAIAKAPFSATVSMESYAEGTQYVVPHVETIAAASYRYYAPVNDLSSIDAVKASNLFTLSEEVPAGTYYMYVLVENDANMMDGFAVSAQSFTVSGGDSSSSGGDDQNQNQNQDQKQNENSSLLIVLVAAIAAPVIIGVVAFRKD